VGYPIYVLSRTIRTYACELYDLSGESSDSTCPIRVAAELASAGDDATLMGRDKLAPYARKLPAADGVVCRPQDWRSRF